MRYRTVIQMALAMGILSVLSTVSFAATIVFDDGGSNSNWSTAENWLGDVEPSPGHRVDIDEGHAVIISEANEVADGLSVNGNATLYIQGGDLTLGGGSLTIGRSIPGSVIQQNGLVTSISGGDLIIEEFGEYVLSGGTVHIEGGVRVKGGTIEVQNTSTLDVGGDIRFVGNPPGVLALRLFEDTAPTINVGGTLHVNDRVALEIDSANWTGPTAVTVFNALGGIQGDFESVIVNGVPTTDYRFDATGLVVNVSEKFPFHCFVLGVLSFVMVLPSVMH